MADNTQVVSALAAVLTDLTASEIAGKIRSTKIIRIR